MLGCSCLGLMSFQRRLTISSSTGTVAVAANALNYFNNLAIAASEKAQIASRWAGQESNYKRASARSIAL